MRKHALLNAIVPGIQVIALQLAWLAGGVVLVEKVFNYPGIGNQLVDSVQNHDVPMVQALSMIIAGVYVVVNLVADLLSILLTPRARTAISLMTRDRRRSSHHGHRAARALDVPRRCGRSGSSSVGIITLAVVLFALFGPLFAPYGENEVVGPPYSLPGRVRHRLPRPGRALPADVRRHSRS